MNPDAAESKLESPIPHPLFALIREDIQRYFQIESRTGKPRTYEKLRIVLDSPGLHAVLVFRFGSWLHRRVRFALIRYPLIFIYYILQKLCIAFWGIFIDDNAQIGGGLYVAHFGGVVIGPVKMGRDCNIAHNVTIGTRAGAESESVVPTIGDRVWIGAGSILFGGITIGDGVTIGPLTLVGRNLPSRVLVIGNPMRLLRKNYDNSAEIYGKNRQQGT